VEEVLIYSLCLFGIRYIIFHMNTFNLFTKFKVLPTTSAVANTRKTLCPALCHTATSQETLSFKNETYFDIQAY